MQCSLIIRTTYTLLDEVWGGDCKVDKQGWVNLSQQVYIYLLFQMTIPPQRPINHLEEFVYKLSDMLMIPNIFYL